MVEHREPPIDPAGVKTVGCLCEKCVPPVDEPHGAISRTSPDGSVTVTVPCDEAEGELP